MFIQVMQGHVRDEQQVRTLMDRWLAELEPGASGWLGGTYGVTDDGMMVAVVRFESKEAAQANSDRPEQTAWWQQMQACFDGDVTFHDCDDVSLMLQGGSDDAGFVQIIQGRVTDRERARSMAEQAGAMITEYRPDVIGATIAIDDDGWFTETVAFTSEAAAREGESKEMPPDAQQRMEEEMSMIDDLHYLDLHHPWFATHHS